MDLKIKSALAMLALAISVVAATRSHAADSIVGTWRMVSWSEEETESKVRHTPFGEHPIGSISYTADGHMMVMFADPNRKPSASPRPTEAEAADLYRTMVAYTGTYSVDGDKITHKIDVAWNQAWNGTSQTRSAEVKDDRMTIKTPPFVSPFLNKQIVATLIFERAK